MNGLIQSDEFLASAPRSSRAWLATGISACASLLAAYVAIFCLERLYQDGDAMVLFLGTVYLLLKGVCSLQAYLNTSSSVRLGFSEDSMLREGSECHLEDVFGFHLSDDGRIHLLSRDGFEVLKFSPTDREEFGQGLAQAGVPAYESLEPFRSSVKPSAEGALNALLACVALLAAVGYSLPSDPRVFSFAAIVWLIAIWTTVAMSIRRGLAWLFSTEVQDAWRCRDGRVGMPLRERH